MPFKKRFLGNIQTNGNKYQTVKMSQLPTVSFLEIFSQWEFTMSGVRASNGNGTSFWSEEKEFNTEVKRKPIVFVLLCDSLIMDSYNCFVV